MIRKGQKERRRRWRRRRSEVDVAVCPRAGNAGSGSTPVHYLGTRKVHSKCTARRSLREGESEGEGEGKGEREVEAHQKRG